MTAHRVLTDLLLAGYEVADPGQGGAIIVDRSPQYVKLVSTADETSATLQRTLDVPEKAGLILILGFDTDGGDLGVYVSSYVDTSSDATITFSNAGEWAELHSISVGGLYYWRVAGGQGAGVPGLPPDPSTITTLTCTTGNITTVNATTVNATTVAAAGTVSGALVKSLTGGNIGITDGQVAASSGTATLVLKSSDSGTPTLTSTGWLPVKVGANTKYIPYFDATH